MFSTKLYPRLCYSKKNTRVRWKKRKGEGLTLSIWNEDMNDITIVKLFENSVVLIDGDSQTIKHEVKNDFLVYH